METQNCWLADRCKKLHCNDANGCMILFKLNYLYDQAGITLHQRKPIDLYPDADGTDYDKFEQLLNIQNNIEEFINEGNQLLIHSQTCGCGKTSWALRLIQSFFNKIWFNTTLSCRALFINVPQFLLALKDNITDRSEYIKHIKENILNCDVVIWDDIGTKNSTVFEAENLLSMIDGRIINGKSNIFTSNLTDEELHQALGDRLASRICNLSTNIVLNGKDKRFITHH